MCFIILAHPSCSWIPDGSFGKTDSDVPVQVGHPSRKPSQAIKALLDQIQQTEIGKQLESNDPAIESEPESDSNPQASSSDSEEGPITVAPIQ